MIRDYIILAVGSFILGVLISLSVLALSHRLLVDVFENLWLLAVPAVLTVIINVILLEIYHKFKKKKD